MELRGKVAVVTGASKGLGLCLAEELVKEGARVVISSRGRVDLEAAAAKIGVFPFFFVADVSVEKDVEKLANEAVSRFGCIDIWVNNAGVWIPQGTKDLDMARVRDMFGVNVFGLMNGSKAALSRMAGQDNRGTIVNIISTVALKGQERSPAYCASKFAADGYTKLLALEAEREGVRVIAVYPGGMRTNFHDEKKPADWEDFMDPADVAEKIVANLKADAPEKELVLKRPRK